MCFEFSLMSITWHFIYRIGTANTSCGSARTTRTSFHDKLFLVSSQDERVPLTPCVVYSGPSLEQAEFLHLHVDNRNIFRVSNAEEGMIALMSAFFIFNIVYGRKAFNTTTVLERLFLGMSNTSPRPVATKFVNKVVQAIRRWKF